MNKVKLYVIIPDISSGDYFNKKLKKQNIETEYDYYKISPRVINNKLTTSSNVVNDMNSIFKKFTDKTRSIVIACNTLQLWLKDIDPVYKKNVKIYTTFEACDWQFRKLKIKPLWLGTTPLVERVISFPTLLTYKQELVQNKVQELIWRIKMLNGDDISTAFDSVKSDMNKSKIAQNKIIKILKQEIIKTLIKLNIKKVILGCTELPMIFKEKEFGIDFIDPADVLAKFVKAQSVILLFAGGTISSIAGKDGALIGGHVFDLIEKLSENMPGSFKHLNITKSDIVYSGLSENISFSVLNKIWKSVKNILISNPARIVITHGTDAIEQTARFLEKKLRSYKKNINTKIVLTAANFPPDNPNTDAWENMKFAIGKKIPKSKKNYVYIGFQNRLIPSNEAVKEYFLGEPMKYISKNDKRFLNKKIQYMNKVLNLISILKNKMSSKINKKGILTYNVNVIRKNHNTFLKKINNNYCRVILFKLYHSGTANTTTDADSSVSNLIKKLTKKGIICFGATENGEPTNLHTYETSVKLLRAGLIPLYDMLFEVALYKLYLLNIEKNNLKKEEIIKKMLKNYGGEINTKLIILEDIKTLIQIYK
jgi:L-asparaginase/Glu-tRNA(Gln) amidotransferase subunit D